MTPLIRRPFWTAALAAVLTSLAANAQADTYPSKNITLVVPFTAGSGTDLIARGLSQALSKAMKDIPVIVENRPGASGMIAAQAVAHAAPDGYTIFMTTNTTQAANQFLFKSLSYDPVKDFMPVSALAKGAMVLVVPASSAIKTPVDLIAAAKKRQMNFGAGSSSSRVAGELFRQMTGADLSYVPYKGNPQAVTDLIGGQLDVMFADTATALPLVRSGRLRALAYTGIKRSPTFPGVPTLDESGVKGYELYYWVGAYVPRGTPVEIVKKLNNAFVAAVRTPGMVTVYEHAVLDAYTTTPEELALFQQSESAKWSRIIKSAGIVPE